MASKRMQNRVYWAHVKAQTYHPGTELAKSLKEAYYATFKLAYPASDPVILEYFEDDLLRVETEHGPAGLRCVHNRDLWPTRERLAMSQG